MAGNFHFPDSHSQSVAAALVASKRMNEAADKARLVEGATVQCSNQALPAKAWKGASKEVMRLLCPHCKQPCIIRTSEQVTVLTRQSVYCCVNAECGHTFVALTEIVRTLSPSATPDPSVNLPISSHVRRDMLRAQLDYAATAPHTPCSTLPVTDDLFKQGAKPPD